MKRITVRYFAMFREHAGVGEETLELDATTARDVFDATRDRHGSAEPRGHCKVHHKTGVEMEALTGASVAALTIYDMCKALSHDIVIGPTLLMGKTGGKKDFARDE